MNQSDVQTVGEVLAELLAIPHPALGIDLDAPLDGPQIFFNVLLRHWPGRVIGFTQNSERGQSTVDRLDLNCDEVIFCETSGSMAEKITRSGVSAVISGDNEMLRHVSHDRARLQLI